MVEEREFLSESKPKNKRPVARLRLIYSHVAHVQTQYYFHHSDSQHQGMPKSISWPAPVVNAEYIAPTRPLGLGYEMQKPTVPSSNKG